MATIGAGPDYAVKLLMGVPGSFDGLRTSVQGQVLNADDQVIPGLYAAGNDRASGMGGNHPGAGITLGPLLTFAWMSGNHLTALAREGAARGSAAAQALRHAA